MCPSREASAPPSCIRPMTNSSTGKVCPKLKSPPCNWCSRKRTPIVMTTTGPIRPRIVQLWQWQRLCVLICAPSSVLVMHAIAQHQKTNTD